MEKILQFPFYRIQKLEYPIIFNRTIAIFEKHKPEELLLNDIVIAVKSKKDLADSLKLEKLDHPLTAKILNLGKMRRYFTSSLWSQIKSLDRANSKAVVRNEKIDAVYSFSKTYFASFFSKRASVRGQITTQFLNDLDGNEVMKQYFAELGLSVLTGSIKDTHVEMQNTIAERTADLSFRSKSETERIKKELAESLRNLYNAVSVASAANPTLDYQPLVKELNVELKAMIASLKKAGKALPEVPAENGETNSEEVI